MRGIDTTDKELTRLFEDFLATYPVRFLSGESPAGYAVDFYSPTAGVALLFDRAQDAARDKALRNAGTEVLYLSRAAVRRNFAAVCAHIDDTVKRALTTMR